MREGPRHRACSRLACRGQAELITSDHAEEPALERAASRLCGPRGTQLAWKPATAAKNRVGLIAQGMVILAGCGVPPTNRSRKRCESSAPLGPVASGSLFFLSPSDRRAWLRGRERWTCRRRSASPGSYHTCRCSFQSWPHRHGVGGGRTIALSMPPNGIPGPWTIRAKRPCADRALLYG